MKRNRFAGFYVLVGTMALTLFACQSKKTALPATLFKALAAADEMRIEVEGVAPRSVQGDRVHKAATLMGKFRQGWLKSGLDTPAPTMNVYFLKGKNTLGRFGVGTNVLTYGEGNQWYRPLPDADGSELRQLLE